AAFQQPDLRRVMAPSFDRQAFIDILTEGVGDIGGVMQPPPAGLWGRPPEMLQALTGHDPDMQKNRAEARPGMQKLGYGPDSRLEINVSVRALAYLLDPAVIMIDQMKQVYIDGDLEQSILRIGFRRSCARITSSASPTLEVGPDPDQNLQLLYG